MDRYIRVIRDVQGKTEEGLLDWKAVSGGKYWKGVINPDRVIRAYYVEYGLAGGKEYVLLFVERRLESYDDYGDTFERIAYELHVLDHEGELVLPLYEGVVDRDDLIRLASLIEEHNDRAKSFFAAFDGNTAA
jgi:hypothetical protein